MTRVVRGVVHRLDGREAHGADDEQAQEGSEARLDQVLARPPARAVEPGWMDASVTMRRSSIA